METDLIRMGLSINLTHSVHLKLSGILEQHIREDAEKYQHCSVKDPCFEMFFLHSRLYIYCTIIKLTMRFYELSVLTGSFFIIKQTKIALFIL